MTTLVECTDAGVRGLLRLRHPWSVAIGLASCCVALTLWWTCLSGPAGAARALKAVGNYGEIFERNLGKKTPLAIERGINALWNAGGLLYAPPVR